jgi:hypothetical protein
LSSRPKSGAAEIQLSSLGQRFAFEHLAKVCLNLICSIADRHELGQADMIEVHRPAVRFKILTNMREFSPLSVAAVLNFQLAERVSLNACMMFD